MLSYWPDLGISWVNLRIDSTYCSDITIWVISISFDAVYMSSLEKL